MKKIISIIMSGAVICSSAIAFAGCSDDADGDQAKAVNLVAVNNDEVGVRTDVDYYVVPEPAATTKVNAMQTLGFSGSLQELYGGEDGYPQAVVVAKNELMSYSLPYEFMSALEKNAQWILNAETSAETVVNSVSSHLSDGMTPTFNAKNLTKAVIENCNISFVDAVGCKEQIKEFMTSLNTLGTDFGTPADKFFNSGSAPSVEYGGSINVYAPDGAPALGLANLLAGEESLSCEVNYEIVNSSLIQTYVSGAQPQADFCILPVNLAVKLLGNGDKYTLLGTLTHGNLFIVSNGGEEITRENIASLKGKTVGVVNLAAVPGLTFKLILKNNGIEFNELV